MAPVYFLEIYKVYKALYENSEDSHENKTLLKVKHVLVDLYRNDQVLADRELHRFSVQNSNQNSKKNISDFDLCVHNGRSGALGCPWVHLGKWVDLGFL